jgi:bacterioferritin
LNKALELEHGAAIQYLSHAEIINGLNAEPIISRLKEIAGDELKHAQMFRDMIGALGGTPSLGVAKTYPGRNVKQILEQNLKNEMEAVDAYKGILEALKKENLKYEDVRLEHEVRHVIIDEMEHIEELRILLALI